MRKRLLAAALVLCMALAMLPVGALAAEKSITDFIKLSANMDEQPVPKRTYDIRYWWQDEVRKTLTSAERAELENKYKMDDWAGLIMEDDTCVGYYQAVKRSSSYSQEYMYYMPEELELTFETIKDGKQGVEALEGYIDISAYSDPDGDGIYDQRAAVGYGDGYYPVSASETGPLMGEINRGESSGISTLWFAEKYMSGNQLIKYIPACERGLGMYYLEPKTVITGAEMKDLFGPDTIVEIEVCVGDIYGGSTTSAFYSFYIPGRSQTTEPLTINHSSASLTVGDTLELSVSGGDSTAKTVWTSANEKVVSVNNGMITGVAPGTATVTATKGNGTATCQVTVPGLAMPQKASEIFVDVEAGSWYEEAVTFAVEKGLFKGVDETHFAPAVTTTRAMIMTVLARLDGQKADTYDEAVKWAVDSGVSDGSNINAVITREQFVTMLYRYAEQPEASGELTGFADMTEVSDWAWVAMSWAVDNGIIKGNEQSQLSPKAAATRAEAAAIMQRYITLIEK